MENKGNENNASQNVGKSNQEAPDATALQAKVDELEGSNKQLFERAKKAEGFEKDGEGNWVKEDVKETKESKSEKKETKSKKSDEEFGLLQKTFLRSAGIKEADEIELAEKLQKETGKDIDVLIESKYFKSELEELRDANATTKATSGVEGGSGGTKATSSPEHWIAKGVPPTKEDIPNRAERTKIHRAMMKNASTSGKKFYND